MGPLVWTPPIFIDEAHKQFDCVEKRLRLLAYMEFLRHMGTEQTECWIRRHRQLAAPIEPEVSTKLYGKWPAARG